MKKLIFILLGLVFFRLQAQNLPQGISYQAVAIKKEKVNLGGENLAYIYWSKKDIAVRFSIYDTYPNGNVEYSETHDTKTDDYGVFNLIIGKGDKISGNFEDINWELGDAHLKIEIDFDGFGAFELIGVEKFWSVPYAFVSKKQSSNNSENDSLFNDLLKKYHYLDSLNQDLFDSLNLLNKMIRKDKDSIVGNEFQSLFKFSDTIFISNGNGIKLLDDDSTNELQKIYIKNDSIILNKGGGSIALDLLNNTKSKFSDSANVNSLGILTRNSKSDLILDSIISLNRVGINKIYDYTFIGDSIFFLGFSSYLNEWVVVSLSLKNLKSPFNGYVGYLRKSGFKNFDAILDPPIRVSNNNQSNFLAVWSKAHGIITYNFTTNQFFNYGKTNNDLINLRKKYGTYKCEIIGDTFIIAGHLNNSIIVSIYSCKLDKLTESVIPRIFLPMIELLDGIVYFPNNTYLNQSAAGKNINENVFDAWEIINNKFTKEKFDFRDVLSNTGYTTGIFLWTSNLINIDGGLWNNVNNQYFPNVNYIGFDKIQGGKYYKYSNDSLIQVFPPHIKYVN